jgi:hypothetical protein
LFGIYGGENRVFLPRLRADYYTGVCCVTFDSWYPIFPRRIAKGAARKAYLKALDITSADTLYWGATAYSAACEGEDPRFIKHPATWLNQECWDDEYEVKKEWGTVTYTGEKMKARHDKQEAKKLRLVE